MEHYFNRENLERTVKYLREEVLAKGKPFNMEIFREGQEETPICDSAACVIGYATALDAERVIGEFTYKRTKTIRFIDWSYMFFFNIKGYVWNPYSYQDCFWKFLFDCVWKLNEKLSTLEGAIKKIEWFLSSTDEQKMDIVNAFNANEFNYENFTLPEN